jgi:hypothetical protein
MHRTLRCFFVALVLTPAGAIIAQDTTVVTPPPPTTPAADSVRCGFCHHPNVPLAVLEPLLISGTINRFNAWVLKDSTAYVSPKTWRHNLHQGFDWDNDDFVVNMLGHPFMGSTYFNAARSNGLGYWAAAPLTVLHSAGWEYFGETTQPSVNDMINTSLGGIALGEMFHRVAINIRNNELGGSVRILRELAALPFDPVGTVNRLVSGEWTRRGPNPSDHNPAGTVLWTGAGAGIVRAPGTSFTNLQDAQFSSILFADLKYGDAYVDTLRKPFDAFSLRVLLAPGHGDLTQLVGVGTVVAGDIGRSENFRSQFQVNQRFEYVNNGALQFGAQTIQLAFSSRTRVVGGLWFRGLVGADGLVLAGINAPGAGTGPRTYDFGPGVGATLSAGLEYGGVPYLTAQYQPAYTHTISGARADHHTSFTAVEATIPILDHVALIIHGTYYTRTSSYADGSSSHRAFPEIRVFAAYKMSHGAPVAQ